MRIKVFFSDKPLQSCEALLQTVDFGARQYDAETGTWTSPDPVRQFDSPYLYGNPLHGLDLDGMEITVHPNDDGGIRRIDFTADVYFKHSADVSPELKRLTANYIGERINNAWGVHSDEGVNADIRVITDLAGRDESRHLIEIGTIVLGDMGEWTNFAGLVNKIGGRSVQLNWYHIRPPYTPVPGGFPDEGISLFTIEHEFGHFLGFYHNEVKGRGWVSDIANEIMAAKVRRDYKMDPRRENEILKNYFEGRMNVR